MYVYFYIVYRNKSGRTSIKFDKIIKLGIILPFMIIILYGTPYKGQFKDDSINSIILLNFRIL